MSQSLYPLPMLCRFLLASLCVFACARTPCNRPASYRIFTPAMRHKTGPQQNKQKIDGQAILDRDQ